MRILYASLILALLGCNPTQKNSPETKVFKGDYLGQDHPSSTPLLFAPGFISTGLFERDFTISPDGKEIYYSLMGRDFSVIMQTKQVDGVWTQPQVAPFSGNRQWLDAEPHISPDGQKFFFLSTRPKTGFEPKPGWFYQDIWVMDKTATGWSTPYNLGNPVNTDAGEYYPSVTNDGTLYFTREEEGRKQAIYRSKLVQGKYTEPERLPEQINTGDFQYNACIAPDESYLILCTPLKEGAIGRVDYCISFRSQDDTWSPLINMGPKMNTPECRAISPSITPDGKYLFFGSQQRIEQTAPQSAQLTLEEILKENDEPGNGNFDIYWVSTELINELK